MIKGYFNGFLKDEKVKIISQIVFFYINKFIRPNKELCWMR